jgi:hypothetical protein
LVLIFLVSFFGLDHNRWCQERGGGGFFLLGGRGYKKHGKKNNEKRKFKFK